MIYKYNIVVLLQSCKFDLVYSCQKKMLSKNTSPSGLSGDFSYELMHLVLEVPLLVFYVFFDLV